MQKSIEFHLPHYGRFWEILSPNWGMNFCSCDFIFIIFLKNVASKAQKIVDHVSNFEIFEIEIKLHLLGINFDIDFWDEKFQNRP